MSLPVCVQMLGATESDPSLKIKFANQYVIYGRDEPNYFQTVPAIRLSFNSQVWSPSIGQSCGIDGSEAHFLKLRVALSKLSNNQVRFSRLKFLLQQVDWFEEAVPLFIRSSSFTSDYQKSDESVFFFFFRTCSGSRIDHLLKNVVQRITSAVHFDGNCPCFYYQYDEPIESTQFCYLIFATTENLLDTRLNPFLFSQA